MEKQKYGFVIPLITTPNAGVFIDIWGYDLKTKGEYNFMVEFAVEEPLVSGGSTPVPP